VLQMVTANIILQYMQTTDFIGSTADSLPLNVTTMDIADTKSRIQARLFVESATEVSSMRLYTAVLYVPHIIVKNHNAVQQQSKVSNGRLSVQQHRIGELPNSPVSARNLSSACFLAARLVV